MAESEQAQTRTAAHGCCDEKADGEDGDVDIAAPDAV